MKKAYTKPEIIFESFTLSSSIAANCEVTNSKDDRLYFTGLGYAFTSSCDYSVEDVGGDGEFNGICYHVLSNDFNLYNS